MPSASGCHSSTFQQLFFHLHVSLPPSGAGSLSTPHPWHKGCGSGSGCSGCSGCSGWSWRGCNGGGGGCGSSSDWRKGTSRRSAPRRPFSPANPDKAAILGLDSFSILFNHRSFQKPHPFSLGFWRSSRNIPRKNGEGTPRTMAGASLRRKQAKNGLKPPEMFESNAGDSHPNLGDSELPNGVLGGANSWPLCWIP